VDLAGAGELHAAFVNEAARVDVCGAPCRKSGYLGRKRLAKPTIAFCSFPRNISFAWNQNTAKVTKTVIRILPPTQIQILEIFSVLAPFMEDDPEIPPFERDLPGLV
jgi:hypothetical protein